jgi:hypothetical protein
MTEPQRWDEPSRRWQAVDNGAWVRYDDAKAWVEREVAAARTVAAKRRKMHDPCTPCWMDDHDACIDGDKCVCRVCDERRGYEQGQRDGRSDALREAFGDLSIEEFVAEAEQRGREQGQRDERQRIRAGFNSLVLVANIPTPDWHVASAAVAAVIDGTTPQDGTP